ncbi:ribosome small subunit-dependent GTPase A [Patescibacteria group bacterium]
MNLENVGWNESFEEEFNPLQKRGFLPMRITRENKSNYEATDGERSIECVISGKFRFSLKSKSEYPAVGDWVGVSTIKNGTKGVIRHVMSRQSMFSRKVAGETTEEQVVAANIDTVFIVVGLDENFNLRRIERYLSVANESGATPVVILNKSDICPNVEELEASVRKVSKDVPVHALSAHQAESLEVLDQYIQPGKTVAFLGSSGVGKSSIINALRGTDEIEVKEVSSLGSRGAHTTTHRELIQLPEKGMVIDTPGMRELQVWGDDAGLKQAFDDVEQLARDCHYKDCAHDGEPGCAVAQAIESGQLDAARLQSYNKLKKEYEYISMRQTMTPDAIEKKRWKEIRKFAKKINKDKYGR